MANGWTPDEIEQLNIMARLIYRNFLGLPPKPERDLWPDMTQMVEQAKETRKENISEQISKLEGELDIMNTYEKTVIRNYMNIEYGPGSTVEQLTNAYGYFGSIAKFVQEAGYEVSKDLQMVVDSCKRDLDIKIKDQRLKDLRALELQRDNYLTRSEKLGNIEKEIKRLQELTK
jgi:hypothetical protein